MAIDTGDPKFESMITHPKFRSLPKTTQIQLVNEYKQKMRGQIPKVEDVLGNALNAVAEGGRTAFQVGQGVMQNLPQNVAENPTAFSLSGIPGVQLKSGAQGITGLKDLLFGGGSISPETTSFSEEYMKPRTDIGEGIGTVGNFITSLINPAKIVGAIPETIDVATVGNIQKAFRPWKRKNYAKYGRVLKEEAGKLSKSGKGMVSSKEGDSLVSGIKYADEGTKAQLPKKAMDIAQRVGKGNIGILELMKEKTRLARTLTSAERSGKIVSEKGRIVGNTINNIEKFTSTKLPNVAKQGNEYGRFVGIRDLVQKMFEPQFSRMGVQGTAKGTASMRGMGAIEPAEKLMLSRFSEQTGVPILGPSQFSGSLRGVGSSISKVAPYAAGLGGTIYLADLIKKAIE